MTNNSSPLSGILSVFSQAMIFDLEHPRKMHDPIFPGHWPGYVYMLYRRHEPGLERRTSASGMIITPEHAGTHMDALCHQAEEMRMFGGVAVTPDIQTPAGFTQLGIDAVAPVFRRGILLDVPTVMGERPRPRSLISATVLQAACERQQVVIQPGDVVLVRTGYGAVWADNSAYLQAAGIAGDASEWLASYRPFAVGSDNVAWDLPGAVDERIGSTLPGHAILLVRWGIHIIENLFLEALADYAAYEFLFIATPLKFQGGTGSPVRPLAVIPNPISEEATTWND